MLRQQNSKRAINYVKAKLHYSYPCYFAVWRTLRRCIKLDILINYGNSKNNARAISFARLLTKLQNVL